MKKKKKVKKKKELRAIILDDGDEDISEFEYVFSFYDEKAKKDRYMCYDDVSDMRYDGWNEDCISALLEIEKDKYKKYFY